MADLFGVKLIGHSLLYTFNTFDSEELAKSKAKELNEFLVNTFNNRKNEGEDWESFWFNIYHSLHAVDKVVKKEIIDGLSEIVGKPGFGIYPFSEYVRENPFFVCE